MSYIEKVKEFHVQFGHPNPEKITLDKQIVSQRIGYILEEIKELDDASKANDAIEILDALCDIQYFLSGTIVALGMSNVFDVAFNKIHENNMTKACLTEEEAHETQEYYDKYFDKDTTYEKVGEKFVVLDSKTRKVLKSIKYEKVNLKDLFTDDFEILENNENNS